MKQCPKCNTEHNKTGIYCSRKCANSRTFSSEAIEKKRISNSNYWHSLTEEEQKQIAADKRSKYDYADQQRRAAETKRQQSWSRPHEEMGSGSVKKRLLHERGHICEQCGVGNSWQGKPLMVEMDHINGNNKDNHVENLRLLCPNCHSQTPTFRARNIKTNKKVDVILLTEELKKHKFAKPALKALGFNDTPYNVQLANGILKEISLESNHR
jgi:HNH endonuclease